MRDVKAKKPIDEVNMLVNCDVAYKDINSKNSCVNGAPEEEVVSAMDESRNRRCCVVSRPSHSYLTVIW